MTINLAAPAHIFTTVLLYWLHDTPHYLHRLLLYFCTSCILFENYTQLHTQFSRLTKLHWHMRLTRESTTENACARIYSSPILLFCFRSAAKIKHVKLEQMVWQRARDREPILSFHVIFFVPIMSIGVTVLVIFLVPINKSSSSSSSESRSRSLAWPLHALCLIAPWAPIRFSERCRWDNWRRARHCRSTHSLSHDVPGPRVQASLTAPPLLPPPCTVGTGGCDAHASMSCYATSYILCMHTLDAW